MAKDLPAKEHVRLIACWRGSNDLFARHYPFEGCPSGVSREAGMPTCGALHRSAPSAPPASTFIGRRRTDRTSNREVLNTSESGVSPVTTLELFATPKNRSIERPFEDATNGPEARPRGEIRSVATCIRRILASSGTPRTDVDRLLASAYHTPPLTDADRRCDGKSRPRRLPRPSFW